MADIMLVLLIIFMITTPLLQSGITVNLPKAKNPLEAPDAESKEAVVVALDRQGVSTWGRIRRPKRLSWSF
jgi:biopolymer transport protein TolR